MDLQRWNALRKQHGSGVASDLARTAGLDQSSVAVSRPVVDDEGVPVVDDEGAPVFATGHVPVPQTMQLAVDTAGEMEHVGERVDEAQADAAEALAEAVRAGVTADGKNTIFGPSVEAPVPPEGGFSQGDQWARSEGGNIVEMLVWDGTEWKPLTILANELIVVGDDGVVRVADGKVTARALAVDAVDGKIIRGVDVYGGRFVGGSYEVPGVRVEQAAWMPDHPIGPTSDGWVVANDYEATGTFSTQGEALTFWAGADPAGSNPWIFALDVTFTSTVPVEVQAVGDSIYNPGVQERWEIRPDVPRTVRVDATYAGYNWYFKLLRSTAPIAGEPTPTVHVQLGEVHVDVPDGRIMHWGRNDDGDPALRFIDEHGYVQTVLSHEGLMLADKSSGEKFTVGVQDGILQIPSLTASPAQIEAGIDNTHYVTPAGLSGGGNIGWTNIPLSGGYTGPLEACLINGFVYFRGQIDRSTLATMKIGNLPSQKMFPTGKHRVFNAPSAATDIGKIEVRTGGEIYVAGVPSGRNYLILDPIAYPV